MRKRPCLLFACIFLTGIVFQRYEWTVLGLMPLVVIVPEGVYAVRFCGDGAYNPKQQKNYLRRMAGRSLVLLSAFFLGAHHMGAQQEFRDKYMSKLQDDSDAVIYGEIIKIETTDYGYRLILTDCYVSLKEATLPCNKVMVYASSDQFHVGQIYQIKGQLNLFESARNEGNFDSALFYQSQKIDFSIYASEWVLLDSNEHILRDGILSFKEKLEAVYASSLEEAAAGFYMGMMLGDKSLLTEKTKDLFAVGGISHILAISGLHMSIIGRGFYKQLRKRKLSFLAAGVLAGLLVVSYCYMVGSGTSALRAVGMLLIYFLSQYIGRSYDMLNALGAVVMVLLLDNPFLIDYSGFQFSIAALLGVGFVGEILSKSGCESFSRARSDSSPTDQTIVEPVGKHKDEKERIGSQLLRGLWQKTCAGSRTKRGSWQMGLWMSMGITLTTLPIVASCYYEIPLYSTLVNSIALPILTPIFILALFGALVGCVFPVIGKILLILCEWLFYFYEFLCSFVEGLPFGCIITGKPKLEVVVIYYAVLFLGTYFIYRSDISEKNRLSLNSPTAQQKVSNTNTISALNVGVTCSMRKILLTIFCFSMILWPKPAQSEIIFLDVGQGDGIYIGSGDGTTFFIDGGSSDVNQVGTYRILPFLKAHGVRQIDYWFVSHADTDHISGLLEVIEDGYEIGYLVLSDKMPEDESREQLLSMAEQSEIEVVFLSAGDQIGSLFLEQENWFLNESICITCLYPWELSENKNEQSMVLFVEFFDETGKSVHKSLFSGDISSSAEKELLSKGVLKNVDLYKVAHHGSKYSNSSVFLESIQPELCVISCGIDNSYGHPHEETLERLGDVGCQIHGTAEYGQVTIEIPSKTEK